MLWRENLGIFNVVDVESSFYTDGVGGAFFIDQRPHFVPEQVLSGPDEVSDEEGCPDYDPPQDPEPPPDRPSSPTSD